MSGSYSNGTSAAVFFVSPDIDEDAERGERFTLDKPNGRLGTVRWAFGFAVNHPISQMFLTICVVANCLLLGITATDLVVRGNNIEFWKSFVNTLDLILLIIFTIESAFQFIYHWLHLFKDVTLAFDLFLVVMSWSAANMTGFKFVRVFRALRLLHVGSIKDLIIALTTVAPKLGMISLLSLLMLYIFAVLFTQLFKEGSKDFRRLDITLFTMLQMMTLDFAEVMRETMKHYPNGWIPFILFLLVMGFLMFNLTVAVVCDSVGAMNTMNQKQQQHSDVKRNIKLKLFSTTKMMSDVILIQQKLIEEHLEVVSDYVLKKEEHSAEYAQKFQDFFMVNPVETTIEQGKKSSQRKNKTKAEENQEDKPFRPDGIFAMERQSCGSVVNHPLVQKFILTCIVSNCAVMGLGATDLYYNPDAVAAFEIIDEVFLLIFTAESAMQLFYLGVYILKDGWSTFDMLIVISSWALKKVQVVRGFRVIRALRVTLRVGPIKDLLSALFKCLEKLSVLILLSMLMLYIFAVLFTQLYKNLKLSEDYYTRLDFTLFTLIQIMTLDFATPMREAMKTDINAWVTHVLFVLVMGLLFFNLMAGVVCDAMQHLKDKNLDKSDDVHDLSFRLRCLSYEISILKNSKKSIHDHLAMLSNIVQYENKRRIQKIQKSKRQKFIPY